MGEGLSRTIFTFLVEKEGGPPQVIGNTGKELKMGPQGILQAMAL